MLWHVIRKAIWQNLKVRNFTTLHNIRFWFFFQCTKLRQPRGLIENKQILHNISRFLIWRFHQIDFLMTCQQHCFTFFKLWSSYIAVGWNHLKRSTVKSRALDRPKYYSILELLGQRSQYISINFLLHKPSENLKTCY